MELPENDWKTINKCLGKLYRELDRDRHARVLLDFINELVPADSVALNIVSIKTPYAVAAITLPADHATADQLALLGRYAHQSPFGTYFLATMDSNWKMATDFMPLEDFHNTDLHRLALRPLGINHQMFGILGVFGETGYGIAVNCTHREFTERDRAVLNLVQPQPALPVYRTNVPRIKKDAEGIVGVQQVVRQQVELKLVTRRDGADGQPDLLATGHGVKHQRIRKQSHRGLDRRTASRDLVPPRFPAR